MRGVQNRVILQSSSPCTDRALLPLAMGTCHLQPALDHLCRAGSFGSINSFTSARSASVKRASSPKQPVHARRAGSASERHDSPLKVQVPSEQIYGIRAYQLRCRGLTT